MLDPFTIIAAAKIITILVTLLFLTYRLLIDWFQQNEELVQADMDNIAFTVKDLYETNNFSLVQGVFNTRTNRVVDGRKIHAKDADGQVKELHRNKPLAIYQ